MELLLILCSLVVLAALVYRARRHERSTLQREFESRVFQTPAGPLRGRELQVVRFVFEHTGGGEGADGLRGGWWYCVAPGPRWLLVIGQDDLVSMTRCEMKWVVRELGEARMRGALAGDAAALRAAFGDAQPG